MQATTAHVLRERAFQIKTSGDAGRTPKTGRFSLKERLYQCCLREGVLWGEGFDQYSLEKSTGFAFLARFAGRLAAWTGCVLHILAARGLTASMIHIGHGVLHRARLCRHTKSRAAERGEHKADNQD